MSDVIVNNGTESILVIEPTNKVVFKGKDGKDGKDAETPDLSEYPKFNDLGNLAFDDLVEWAKLGSTIIEGGYIRTNVIDANAVRIAGGALNQAQVDIRANLITSLALTDFSEDLGSLAWQNLIEASMLGETIIIGGYIKTNLINTNAIIIDGDLATITNATNITNTALTNFSTTLGDLAYDDLVSLAKLDTTIIQGGYIKTSLIDAQAIVVNGGGITDENVDDKIEEALETIGLESLGAGDLAYLNLVEIAQLGNTVIAGGYIKTDLINTSAIIVETSNLGSTIIVGGKIKTDLLETNAIVVNGGGATTTQLATAVNGAISTSSSDATTKANQARLDAISASNTNLSNFTASLGTYAYLNAIPNNAVSRAKLDTTVIDGGYINTALLDSDIVRATVVTANFINALDITTENLRTANTGKRIEIIGANNNFVFYDSSNTQIIQMDDDVTIEGLIFSPGDPPEFVYGPGIVVGHTSVASTSISRRGLVITNPSGGWMHRIGSQYGSPYTGLIDLAADGGFIIRAMRDEQLGPIYNHQDAIIYRGSDGNVKWRAYND